jgi:hypothetical protein
MMTFVETVPFVGRFSESCAKVQLAIAGRLEQDRGLRKVGTSGNRLGATDWRSRPARRVAGTCWAAFVGPAQSRFMATVHYSSGLILHGFVR